MKSIFRIADTKTRRETLEAEAAELSSSLDKQAKRIEELRRQRQAAKDDAAAFDKADQDLKAARREQTRLNLLLEERNTALASLGQVDRERDFAASAASAEKLFADLRKKSESTASLVVQALRAIAELRRLGDQADAARADANAQATKLGKPGPTLPPHNGGLMAFAIVQHALISSDVERVPGQWVTPPEGSRGLEQQMYHLRSALGLALHDAATYPLHEQIDDVLKMDGTYARRCAELRAAESTRSAELRARDAATKQPGPSMSERLFGQRW